MFSGMPQRGISPRYVLVALMAAAVLTAALLTSTSAEAKRRRAPMQNAVCFDTALSAADQSECKKRFSDATTADERGAIRKDFRRRASRAKAAQQQTAPAPPAPPAK